jgi:hypothetical protein
MDDLPLAAYSTGVIPDESGDDTGAPGFFEAPTPASGDAMPPATHPTDATVAMSFPSGGDPLDPLMAAAPGDGAALRLPALPALPPLPVWLANPRAHLRDPRLLLSGVVAVGLILLVLTLLGGGPSSSLTAAGASPSAPTGPVATPAAIGNASVQVAGSGMSATLELTGVTGTTPAAVSTLDSTWIDQLGNTLVLGGPVSPGTRTTAADFVLSWTVIVKAAPVTFTSQAGECTVGMAVKAETVTGSFVCKKVKSSDGKYVVGARGTYRT